MEGIVTFSNRSRLTAALLVAAIVTVAFLALRGGPGDAVAQSTTVVRAVDNKFQPARITIERGSSVRWTNAGNTAHNVKGSGFASKKLTPGGTYSRRFTRTGTFKYVCTIHSGMKGTIAVRK